MTLTRISAVSVFAVLLAVAPPAAAADVGIQTALEQWSASKPDQTSMKVQFDSPSLVSFQVAQAWNQQRDVVCQEIAAVITKADAFGKGVNGYSVNCAMAETGEFHAFPGNGPNQARFTFKLVGNTLAFTTTTPTVMGSYGDPRFNTTYDLFVTIHAAIQNGSPLLKVTSAIGQIQNPHVAPGNFAADVLKEVLGFIVKGGLDGVVSKSVAGQRLNLTGRINSSLALANALLKVPDGTRLAGGWVRKEKVFIAFQPIMSVPSSGAGWVSGKLKWPGQGGGKAASCAAFGVKASVPAGPPAVLGADPWSFGAYDVRDVPYAASLPANATFVSDHFECAYTLSSLPVGLPATLRASVGTGPSNAGGAIPVMAPDGWSGPVVPNASARDFKETWRSSGISPAMRVSMIKVNLGDPDPNKAAVNPAVKAQTNVKAGMVVAPIKAGQAVKQ
jgi:hypothetical protein